MTQKKYNMAVIGATGNVGAEMLKILAERNFPINNIYALASQSSIGKQVSFGEDKVLNILNLEDFDFHQVDIALFSVHNSLSQTYAQKAIESGVKVIDNSSAFRMQDDVPLIVPEVNGRLLQNSKATLIANPNCCVIPLCVALKPLDNAAKIKRIVVSTYQSASGAGKEAMDELYQQTKSMYMFQEIKPVAFEKQIAFNILPAIDKLQNNGYTGEEQKIIDETQKILSHNIKVNATCVRVPVFVGHCLSVNVEFEQNLSAEDAYEILSESDNIQVLHQESEFNYTSPVEVVGEDDVFVSRIRNDNSCTNALSLWISADNIRKGAALNAVQIAELITKIN